MKAKEYVNGMIEALQEEDYERYFELQASFEDDIENVSDEEYDKLCKCVERCSNSFWIMPKNNESEVITALRWFLE